MAEQQRVDDPVGDRFIAWLRANGATVSPKLTLQATAAFNADSRTQVLHRRVIASAEAGFDKEEELFSIPRKLLLSASTSSIAELLLENKKEACALVGWMPLVVAMMYEITNKDSFWRPYLDLLPETLDTPMFWNDDDLELLEGTSTLSHLGKEDAETIFTEQIVPFMKLHPTHFDLKVHNMALYHRVASVIMAYSFSEDDDEDDDDEDDDEEEDCCDGDANNECCSQKRQKRMEKIAMVPLADMLDHKTGCNNARLFYGKTTLAMSCIEPCAAGHELYNTYGDLSNSELLRKYGFIDDVNEHNSVDIPVEMLEERFESCSFMEEAMEALEEIGCWLPEFHIPADALPPQELEASIALLFQSPKQVRALRALDDEDEIRSFLATLVNKCRRKVSETLLAFGQKRAEEYTTTREEDEERLKESDLTHRQKMALRVRIGERTILHNYISHLKERLETTPPDQETKEPAPAHKNKKARKH